MVDAESLYKGFVQSCDSCMLASYAIAAYHFTKIPINNFFEDYCRHYKIITESTEVAYVEHFHKEWQKLKCSGYMIILCLHNNSTQSSFTACRKNFNLEYIVHIPNEIQEIKTKLETQEVLLIAGLAIASQGVHSCAVGYDNQGFYMIETRKQADVKRVESIQSIGDVGDGLLLIKP